MSAVSCAGDCGLVATELLEMALGEKMTVAVAVSFEVDTDVEASCSVVQVLHSSRGGTQREASGCQ